jgi:hypothetical protein
LDTEDIRAIGRRAALMAMIGAAALSAGGCQAITAIIAGLAGDTSAFDEGGAPDGEGDDDPHYSRNDRRPDPDSEAAVTSDDTSDDDLPDDGTIPE